jgi:hypothetical protein
LQDPAQYSGNDCFVSRKSHQTHHRNYQQKEIHYAKSNGLGRSRTIAPTPGVRVFHTYKEDDYDQGAKAYWFTVNPQCGELDRLCDDQPCRHVFDVRDLSTWRAPEPPPYGIGPDDTPENRTAWERYWESEPAAIQAAITAAIERGELTSHGRMEGAAKKTEPLASSSSDAGNSNQPKATLIPEKRPDQA